jgi:hypothetical protein
MLSSVYWNSLIVSPSHLHKESYILSTGNNHANWTSGLYGVPGQAANYNVLIMVYNRTYAEE